MNLTRLQLLIFGGIAMAVIAAVLVFTGVLPGLRTTVKPPAPVTLTFWGVFDKGEAYRSLIASYQKAYPHVSITYVEKPALTYEQDLLNALARGAGPDIFMIHNRWLARWQDKITPLPEAYYTPQTFEQTFADVATFDLVRDGRIWALPFSIDTLALFYNRDLFNQARLVAPPKTWTEFETAVKALTRRDQAGNITTAGAALGTAENVNRAVDVLALLMLQSGSSVTNPRDGRAAIAGAGGEQTLAYYAGFADPRNALYTWNARQHHSLDAFLEGRAAMMLNYNYQIPALRSRAPHLRFAVASAPQPAERRADAAFASYWVYSVSKASPKARESWRFLAFAAQPDILREHLKDNARASARRDLLPEQFSDPFVGPFANQVLVARSYWSVDNLLVEKALNDMIEQVAKGEKTPGDALGEAAEKINAARKR